MTQIIHIFLKDVRRFWWEAALCTFLLAWFARLDSWRAGFTPTSGEGWLNILLPFAWAYLVALVVTEDALVGDNQFWLALPSSRASIAIAKALFIAVFVHLPYLIATIFIVSARGFQPLAYLPQLAGHQLFLFAAVTAPAAALAAVVRHVVQFVLAALVLVAALIGVAGGIGVTSAPWIRATGVESLIALVMLSVGGVGIAVIQFHRRCTTLSRLVGVLCVAVAAAVYLYLPREASAAIRCGAPRSAVVSVALDKGTQSTSPGAYGAPNAIHVSVPLKITGVPDPPRALVDQVALRIDRPGRSTLHATWPSSAAEFESAGLLSSVRWDAGQYWQILLMRPEMFRDLARTPVRITGTATIEPARRTTETSLRVGTRGDVSSTGKCGSSILPRGFYEELLDVACESPARLPFTTRVTLVDRSGRSWTQRLGDSMTYMPYPRNSWLSPMNRRDTFFHLTAEDVSKRQGSAWLVPRDAAVDGSLVFAPEPLASCVLVHYELDDVVLAKYVMPPRR